MLNTEGIKFDEDKIRMELIPPEVLIALGSVLTYGAKKYSPRNWEKGMNWGRVYGALLRHLFSWANPFEPNVDEETNYSHLWHALTCVCFLVTYEQRQIGKNDINEI